MSTAYAALLARKASLVPPAGRVVTTDDVHPMLTDWQGEIVVWACRMGRAAIWAGTGMGKSLMMIEWSRLMADRALIVAPLAVCAQTVREAAKVGVAASYARSDSEAQGPGLWVTNYERSAAFEPSGFGAVVIDEASILKQSEGATRKALTEQWAGVPYRLACTATPAPNDVEELTTQAEWLGVTTRVRMLAAYFIHDTDGWRLKGHARGPMFRWLASWAMAVQKPSDLGFPDGAWKLPPLSVHAHLIDVDLAVPDGELFASSLGGVGGRARVRRQSLAARVEATAALVAAEPDEPWLVWCELNDEAAALAKAIPGAINVHGSLDAEEKARLLLGFADGLFRVLIVKPRIASQGLNFQHCARQAFCGLSDSFESYYQAIRRSWRHGQHRPVEVHVVLSHLEGQVLANVQRKERQATRLVSDLVEAVRVARQDNLDAGIAAASPTFDRQEISA